MISTASRHGSLIRGQNFYQQHFTAKCKTVPKKLPIFNIGYVIRDRSTSVYVQAVCVRTQAVSCRIATAKVRFQSLEDSYPSSDGESGPQKYFSEYFCFLLLLHSLIHNPGLVKYPLCGHNTEVFILTSAPRITEKLKGELDKLCFIHRQISYLQTRRGRVPNL
jgi:hypothetical protein